MARSARPGARRSPGCRPRPWFISSRNQMRGTASKRFSESVDQGGLDARLVAAAPIGIRPPSILKLRAEIDLRPWAVEKIDGPISRFACNRRPREYRIVDFGDAVDKIGTERISPPVLQGPESAVGFDALELCQCRIIGDRRRRAGNVQEVARRTVQVACHESEVVLVVEQRKRDLPRSQHAEAEMPVCGDKGYGRSC